MRLIVYVTCAAALFNFGRAVKTFAAKVLAKILMRV